MITKMNYLLLSTMMLAAIDSTFGRGCDCCKKLCADKDSSGPFINPDNNKTTVEDEYIPENVNTIHNDNNDNIHNENLLKNIGNNNNIENINENNITFPVNNIGNNDNSNFKQIMHDEKFNSKKVNENENEETLYFKIDKDTNDENIKKCFNNKWYEACKNKVLLLQKVDEDGLNVLKVTGSGDKWKITDPQGKVLGSAGCKPEGNKWIIVKITTMQEDSKNAEDNFIFYVDDISSVDSSGVFAKIWCYSIEIIAANTSDMKSMYCMFFSVNSALERDGKEDTGPGLIGLNKLNVENVISLQWMFSMAIHKQITLKQLSEWHFREQSKVGITDLFKSSVEHLDFSVLNGWRKPEDNESVSFFIRRGNLLENVFVQSGRGEDFKAPSWYDNIVEGK